jgi:hypothetical protein
VTAAPATETETEAKPAAKATKAAKTTRPAAK